MKDMNKFFTYILLLCSISVTLSSCDKWLEATSSTQLPADKLFETKSGFYDALTGVYISLGDFDCYGGSYTWKVNDLAAFPYSYQNSSVYEPWQKHQYTSVDAKRTVKAMWSQGYSTIANINMVLRELESHRDVIAYEEEYNLIKGELLGLRAMVHFDMIRMFGVADWNGANADKLTIPYVRKYDKEPEIQRTYRETELLILQDIEEAIVCLQRDPATGKADPKFETAANIEGYWDNRAKHMNYYAVNALAAKFWQWKDDTNKASTYAQKVIDGAFGQKFVNWVDIDQLLIGSNDNQKDWTFSSEHLFSLEVTGLYDVVNSYIASFASTSGIRLSPDLVETLLFPQVDPVTGSVSGGEDVRGPAFLLKYDILGYSCHKLYGSSSYVEKYRNRVPMIKISEMYYIMAEHYITQGNPQKALEMLDIVRGHRGISENLSPDCDAQKELMMEYYREFMFEGQLFYWLKHNDISSSIWKPFSVNADNLIYPYPNEEVNYGRKQEL